MKTKLFLLSMIVAVILSACKGNDGPPGPQGPAGANGTANISNTTFTATPGVWNGSAPWWYVDVSVPALTNPNTSVVQVYVQINGSGSEWWALPVSSLSAANDNYQFAFITGSVRLWYSYTSAPNATWNYRIVVIPSSIARNNPNIDYNNYSKVKAAFNLTD
jgi:hypothetical protein